MRHLGTTDAVATNSTVMAKNSHKEKKEDGKTENTPLSH